GGGSRAHRAHVHHAGGSTDGGLRHGAVRVRPETRSRFHAELFDLEGSVVEMGGLAEEAVRGAVDALVRRDRLGAEAVIAGDDELDNRYLSIERRILDHRLCAQAVRSEEHTSELQSR